MVSVSILARQCTCCLFGLMRQTFSTFLALKLFFIENANKIFIYLFLLYHQTVLHPPTIPTLDHNSQYMPFYGRFRGKYVGLPSIRSFYFDAPGYNFRKSVKSVDLANVRKIFY